MLKNTLRNWYRYLLWALISVMFWSWIHTLLLSAPAKKQVVLYADLPAIDGKALSIALEEDLPEGIRFVQTYSFKDLVFDSTQVLGGDLYLIPESDAKTFLESFAPIDRAAFPGASFYEEDGEAYGVLVYDETAGPRAGAAYAVYPAGERCYLFFNRNSVHLGTGDKAIDDAATVIARHFLELQ